MLTVLKGCVDAYMAGACKKERTKKWSSKLHPLFCARGCVVYLRLARTVHSRCVYRLFGREITEYSVIYGVHIWF